MNDSHPDLDSLRHKYREAEEDVRQKQSALLESVTRLDKAREALRLALQSDLDAITKEHGERR